MSAHVPARQRAQPWRVLRQPSVSRTSRPQQTGATRTVISRLQRDVGNRGLHRLLQSGIIRAKLTIGPCDDEYERKADRVADEVMRLPAQTLGSPAPRASYSVGVRLASRKRKRKAKTNVACKLSVPIQDRRP